MFSRTTTRALVIALAVIIGLYFVADRFGMRSRDRTFREMAIALDTAAVTSFKVHPKQLDGKAIRFDRDPEGWSLTFNDSVHRADNGAVRELLGRFTALRTKRFVGGILLVKDRYQLSDTARNLLTFDLVDGTHQELAIGSSTFAPGEQGAWTYVHVPGEMEVYAVDMNLQSLVDQPPEAWRPHHLVNGEHANWTRVAFRFPTDTGYAFIKRDGIWFIDSVPGDQDRIDKYLQSLSIARAKAFAPGAGIQGVDPVYTLTIADTSRAGDIRVQVFPWNNGYAVTSSVNPSEVMRFDAFREVPRMFRPRSAFIPR